MTIGTGFNLYNNTSAYLPGSGFGSDSAGARMSGQNMPDAADPNARGIQARVADPDAPKTRAEAADPDQHKKAGRKSSPADCETCKTRKYQDGSDENVSYKSAAHISPQAAGAAVRAHENEHVNNAYEKAAKGNGKVLSATVSIHTAICPECGRSYVSGGTTNTMIKYTNEENPYQKELKASDATRLRGANMDLTA